MQKNYFPKMIYVTKIDFTKNTARAKHIRSLMKANKKLNKPFIFLFYDLKKPHKELVNFIKVLLESIKKKETFYTRDLEFAALAIFFQINVIFEIHQFGMIRESTRFSKFNKLILLLLSRSRKINFVTLTKNSARVLNYLFPKIKKQNIYIIPDAGEKIKNIKTKKNSSIKNFFKLNIGYAGSFLPGKGGLETIYLASELQDYRFNIAGILDEEKINKLHNSKNIYYSGYLNDFEIQKFYDDNDVLIAPIGERIFLDKKYFNEITFYTSPLKLFEFLFTNKPVVTINRPCTRIFKNIPGLWIIEKDKAFCINTWKEVLNEVNEFINNDHNANLLDLRISKIYNWENRIKDMIKIK